MRSAGMNVILRGHPEHRMAVRGITRADVERALRYVGLFAIGDAGYDMRRELNAPALNTDDDEIVCPVVQLDDLVSHPPQRSRERAGVEHDRLFLGRSHRAPNMPDSAS